MSFFPPDALRCGVRVYWKAHLSPLCCGLPDHLVAVERVPALATERCHKLLASAAFVLATVGVLLWWASRKLRVCFGELRGALGAQQWTYFSLPGTTQAETSGDHDVKMQFV